MRPNDDFDFFEDICLFRGATLILLFWTSSDICAGSQSHGGSLCVLFHLCDPQIYLWCDTCRLYRGQHGSQTFSIHVLADVTSSIGGGGDLGYCFYSARVPVPKNNWYRLWVKLPQGAQVLFFINWKNVYASLNLIIIIIIFIRIFVLVTWYTVVYQ